MVSIFDYEFPLAHKTFEEADHSFFSLSDFECLLKVALEKEYIKSNDFEMLKSWRMDPQNWGMEQV